MPEYTEDELKAIVDKAVSEATAGLKAKNDELISGRRSDQAKLEEMEAQRLETERLAAEKNGEFEKLYSSTQSKLAETEAAWKLEREQNAQKTINGVATAIAGELSGALGEGAISTASMLIAQNIELNESGEPEFKVGGVTVDKSAFVDNFKTNHSYLVSTVQSSGGGATQQQGGSVRDKPFNEMSRTEKTRLANEDPIKYKQLAGM